MGIKPLVVAARYKMLLILPFLIIVPVCAIVSILSIKTTYTSAARFSTQTSAIIDPIDDGGNPYASPAQNRADQINEKLSTDSFKKRVAQRISPNAGDAEVGALVIEIGNGTAAYALNRHIMVVSHTAPTAARTKVIVQGVVDEFREEYNESVTSQAEAAIKVYQDREKDGQTTLEDAQAALQAYASKLPTGASLLADPNYISLQKPVDRAQSDLASIDDKIQSVRLQLDASVKGTDDQTLKLEDPAADPLGPDPQSKKNLVALPIAGILIALSASGALYAFLFRTDNRIRTVEDLQALPGLLLLGTVPDVAGAKRRRWPKNFFRIAVAGLGVTSPR